MISGVTVRRKETKGLQLTILLQRAVGGLIVGYCIGLGTLTGPNVQVASAEKSGEKPAERREARAQLAPAWKEDLERLSEKALAAVKPGAEDASEGTHGGGAKGVDVEVSEVSDAAIVVGPPPPPVREIPSKKVSVVAREILPGDFVELELIRGVSAMKDETPYPAVFRLVGPILGPNGSEMEINGGELFARAHFSRMHNRIVYELTSLCVRHGDKAVSHIKVDGWIVGSDGIRGTVGHDANKERTTLLSELEGSTGSECTGGIDARTEASDRITKLQKLQLEVSEVKSGEKGIAVFSRPTQLMVNG